MTGSALSLKPPTRSSRRRHTSCDPNRLEPCGIDAARSTRPPRRFRTQIVECRRTAIACCIAAQRRQKAWADLCNSMRASRASPSRSLTETRFMSHPSLLIVILAAGKGAVRMTLFPAQGVLHASWAGAAACSGTCSQRPRRGGAKIALVVAPGLDRVACWRPKGRAGHSHLRAANSGRALRIAVLLPRHHRGPPGDNAGDVRRYPASPAGDARGDGLCARCRGPPSPCWLRAPRSHGYGRVLCEADGQRHRHPRAEDASPAERECACAMPAPWRSALPALVDV